MRDISFCQVSVSPLMILARCITEVLVGEGHNGRNVVIKAVKMMTVVLYNVFK